MDTILIELHFITGDTQVVVLNITNLELFCWILSSINAKRLMTT